MAILRLSRTLVVALLLIFACSTVQADKRSLRQARRLFYRGNTQYRLGNFERALELFQQSLAKASRPNTIFNIAQCHRQLKQPEKALFNYKLYLSEWERDSPGTQPQHLAEVKSHIADLEAQLERARQQKMRREQQAKKEKERRLQAEREAEQRRARAAITTTPTPAPQEPSDSPFYATWWFWTITAAVVGGSVAAVALTTGGDDRVAEGKDGRFDASNF